eukprot:356889-Chlamydomonas_euryale.AAC.1
MDVPSRRSQRRDVAHGQLSWGLNMSFQSTMSSAYPAEIAVFVDVNCCKLLSSRTLAPPLVVVPCMLLVMQACCLLISIPMAFSCNFEGGRNFAGSPRSLDPRDASCNVHGDPSTSLPHGIQHAPTGKECWLHTRRHSRNPRRIYHMCGTVQRCNEVHHGVGAQTYDLIRPVPDAHAETGLHRTCVAGMFFPGDSTSP